MKLLRSLVVPLCLPLVALAADNNDTSVPSIVPRYLLQDAKGRAVTAEDFAGRFQLITFGYTFCPDVCPTTLASMAEILGGLGHRAERLQVIFISIDPERDTPQVLKTYTAFFDDRILGLTASPALVRAATERFRVRYEKVSEPGAMTGHYAMDHSTGMFLLGPDGAFMRKFPHGMPATEATKIIADFMDTTPPSRHR